MFFTKFNDKYEMINMKYVAMATVAPLHYQCLLKQGMSFERGM